jgi:hypothetical protein
MGSEVTRVRERKKSRQQIEDLYSDSMNVYIVHYSCESFYENSTGGSTRVTSIAIRNLKTAQTKSWSIHKAAELEGCLDSIPENFPRLERMMLDGYFDFLRAYSNCHFIHWNMRDENYGFYALEHRYRVLGGTPFELQDNRKVDLARELVTLYGRQYAPHTSASGRKGRIFSIVEYLKLHQSTLRKLDIFSNIFERTHDKTLKTTASWMDVYGISPTYLIEQIKNHWLVMAFILGGAITLAIARYWDSFARLWAFLSN